MASFQSLDATVHKNITSTHSSTQFLLSQINPICTINFFLGTLYLCNGGRILTVVHARLLSCAVQSAVQAEAVKPCQKHNVVCPSVPIVVGLSSKVRIAGLGKHNSRVITIKGDDVLGRMWKPLVTSVVCNSHFVPSIAMPELVGRR